MNIKRRALKRAQDEKRCRITENIVELRDADIGRMGVYVLILIRGYLQPYFSCGSRRNFL